MNFYKFYNLINENLTMGNDDRIHVSNVKLQDNSRRIVGDSSGDINGPGGKPKGLWYGFGNNWIYFTKVDIMFNMDYSYKYTYKVYPNFSKMIVLKTAQDVIDFSKKNFGKNIDWNKVAQNYSGIEIPTYDELSLRNWGSAYRNDQESLENEINNKDFLNLSHQERIHLFSWLYTWDVASGCIWKQDGLIRYEEV